MKIKSINTFETYLFSIIVFLINPFFGVVTLLHILFSNLRVTKDKLINLLVYFLAAFLSFINITKTPENDLHFHAKIYTYVEGRTLLEYLSYIEKEPMGYIFNYIIYHLTSGSVKIWVLTFSLISYILFFIAIKRFCIKIKLPFTLLLLSLVLAAFFPQMFSLSAHLIRQFIAGSIFIFYAVDKIFYKKNRWWLVLIGVLTHGSSAILYAFVLFKFLGDFKKYKFLNITLLILLICYQYIAKILLVVFAGFSPSLDYILERASRDTTFNLGEFQLMNFILMFVMILVAMLTKGTIIKKFEKEVEYLEKSESINEPQEIEKSVRLFFSSMIILSFFIIINIRQSELSNRLFFYLFFYFPFLLPLILLNFKEKSTISYFISILFMVYFAYRIEFGVWKYAPLYKLTTNNIYTFLSYPEPDLGSRKYYW